MKDRSAEVSLTISSDIQFLPLAISFAEAAARAFGLEKTDALKLTLACEETFTYICSISKEIRSLAMKVTNGLYYVRVQFLFNAADFDPGPSTSQRRSRLTMRRGSMRWGSLSPQDL